MQKILIIEDETQTRNLFLNCLKFEGFEALGADNGSFGVQLAQKFHPGLVVCDIMMPDMDGYQVLSQLRQHPETATIPFIFLTAKVTMSELRQGMTLGADDYLTKPCTIDDFLAAIATRFQRQSELRGQMGTPPAPDLSTADRIFPHCPQLNAVFDFIEANYCQPLHLKDVATVAGYSPAYLTHLMQTQTGRTVKQWIVERRMSEARTLLLQTKQSIKKIAITLGYADPGYFIRQFRQHHGTSPHGWRRQSHIESSLS
ncbi:response regulator transcription factor [Acaryochloris marina]|uniref:Two component transcriptional regulator, AraC family n=1 Tax=Acaryochloris marina (strain MBIC 11017) TaxID=329726 RepID=B0C8H6_ACAM1|nr:response regulator [Acaryochloris marina]ABW30131.1 two component transcriptional regulator, AraC family [Acaryochloris marina MBIC11017]BDM78979.1 hypothetical protein AM10699_18470 [Acaryochloris marina MBIC10699]